MYQVLSNGSLEEYYQIDLKDSWMYAAMEKNLPMIVPGWEDSTMGNMFAGHVINGDIENFARLYRRLSNAFAQGLAF